MDNIFQLKIYFSSGLWLKEGMKNLDLPVTKLRFVLTDWVFLSCLVLKK